MRKLNENIQYFNNSFLNQDNFNYRLAIAKNETMLDGRDKIVWLTNWIFPDFSYKMYFLMLMKIGFFFNPMKISLKY